MDKYLKFLNKINKTERNDLLCLIQGIVNGDMKSPNQKKLKGYENLYRIRHGKFRIVYRKEKTTNILVNIDYRKDIYR